MQSEEQKTKQTNKTKQNKREKNGKEKRKLQDIWGTMNRSSIHIMGIPKGAEKEEGSENLFKAIMAGAPGWLDRLSVRLRLRSQSHGL